MDKDAEAILVVKMMITEQIQPLITCKILLTSPLVRTNAEILAEQQEESLKSKKEKDNEFENTPQSQKDSNSDGKNNNMLIVYQKLDAESI